MEQHIYVINLRCKPNANAFPSNQYQRKHRFCNRPYKRKLYYNPKFQTRCAMMIMLISTIIGIIIGYKEIKSIYDDQLVVKHSSATITNNIELPKNNIGTNQQNIETEKIVPVLKEFKLPNEFYGDDIDFSYFQPYMDYQKITDKTSNAYSLSLIHI